MPPGTVGGAMADSVRPPPHESKPHESKPHESKPHESKPHESNRWVKGWRSVFLFGVTIVLVLLGLIFWRASASGEENPYLETGPPQVIGVYSTDPYARIHLTTELTWHTAGGLDASLRIPSEKIYVSVTGPRLNSSSAILISTNIDPTFGLGNLLTPDPYFKRALIYNDESPFSILNSGMYVTVQTLEEIKQDNGLRLLQSPPGYMVGTVVLPRLTQESRGSFFAHLPDIGFDGLSVDQLPDFISLGGSSAQSEKLIENPIPKNTNEIFSSTVGYASSNPSTYSAPPGQTLGKVYWQPASLTTTEILDDVQSELDTSTVNNIEPSNGQLQGDNYVWEGTGPLEPTMSITNQNAAASHSDWAFRSGVVFGVAAGTGVAFVQDPKNPLFAVTRDLFNLLWQTVKTAARRLLRLLRRFILRLRGRS